MLDRGPFDSYPDIVWRTIGALNTYGTNAIEGNTLTHAEVERVIMDREGVKKPIQDILVTVQHESAFRGLMGRRARAIDMVTILELHEDVFKGVMADAGQWRRTRVQIRGASSTPPGPEKVVSRMEAFIQEYGRRDIGGEDAFVLGAWFHHGFESIHPFSDGNGRVGRLVLNLHFLRHSWPPINVLPSDRTEYLDALERAGQGDLEPLKEFIEIRMASSLLSLLSMVGTTRDELRPLTDFEVTERYSAKYLSLRAGQGELPAVRGGKRWLTSRRALDLYVTEKARK